MKKWYALGTWLVCNNKNVAICMNDNRKYLAKMQCVALCNSCVNLYRTNLLFEFN